ncbi:MAG: SH3 domain-containing protein [Lachnospiraceae bacterium]|nr:SH3 domain-containing protein [Lachnospiraceae bacterium]MBQ7780506.1 SH3 domain-containing protein [Lachnospiraceae bacterium]
MNRNKRVIRLLSLCVAGAVLAGAQIPIEAYASEKVNLQEVIPSAGAASLVSMTLDEEECIAVAEASHEAFWGYTNLGIANVESGNLNVRAIPGTDGKLVGKMPKGSACEILEVTEDGWAHIISGEVEGYVSMDYLYIGADAKMRALELIRTVAIVNADSLKVRDEASQDSAVLTQVPNGEELEVIEVLDGWVKVSIDGEEAYVSADYVTVEEKLDTAVTMSELRYGQGVSDLRVDIVEYALQFVGNPYVWGGTSLTKGADCSGFTMSVYKNFGISLSHSSRAQANEGTRITADELQPGDLIFYANSSGTINHVAMYIGNGQVVHASSAKTGIKISKYTYRTPVRYVSILQE